MISIWWLLPAFFLGAVFGIALLALVTEKRDDE